MTISYQPPEGLAQMTAGVQTAQKRAASLAALIVPFNDQKLPVKVWDEAAAKSVKPAVCEAARASVSSATAATRGRYFAMNQPFNILGVTPAPGLA